MHQHLNIYIDETKQMWLYKACFWGIITQHRPSYVLDAYRIFLKQYWYNDNEFIEYKSSDKRNIVLVEQLTQHSFFADKGIRFWGMYVENYKDNANVYLSLLSNIVSMLQSKQPAAYMKIYSDVVKLWIKKSTITNYVRNVAGIPVDFILENSKYSAWVQLSDLFCWALRRKYLYTHNVHDFIDESSLYTAIEYVYCH